MTLRDLLKTVLIHSINLCLVLSLVPMGPGHDNTTYEPADPTLPADSKQIRWANAAYQYMHGLNCKEVFLTTPRECRKLVRIPQEETNIYLAGPTPYGRYISLLPDGSLERSGGHEAVMVLDPYPSANFGHLVLVFNLQLESDLTRCTAEGGTYLADGRECLLVALKRRCKNMLEKGSKRANFARRCEINFLPLVYLEFDHVERNQRLSCRNNIPGFYPCPSLRSANETSGIICDHVGENTRRCETTHETIQSAKACRVFEICDHAIMVSGGWNRQTSRTYHKQNIWDMYYSLRSHGFPKRNIKVFYENGHADGIPVQGEINHEVYPATLKLAMRYHLQRLCAAPHCADSMFIYLNNPAKSDGTMLLWDTDQNGMATGDEKYTLEELLTDISSCEARQVTLVVDQSFSGQIVRTIRKSAVHKNVVVYASSRDHEYSYGTEFTKHWAYTNHTDKCLKEVFKTAQKSIDNSTARMSEGADVSDINLFGAPCTVDPPFTFHELRQNYLGCQNLPTALWLQQFILKDIVPEELRGDRDVRPPLEVDNLHPVQSQRHVVRH